MVHVDAMMDTPPIFYRFKGNGKALGPCSRGLWGLRPVKIYCSYELKGLLKTKAPPPSSRLAVAV